MSHQEESKTTAPSPLEGASAQLAALETELGLSGAVFSRVERVKTRASSRHVPDGLIELIAAHAENNGGAVAGLSFDAATARAALAQSRAAHEVVRAARQLAQRVADDATLQRSEAADRAFGIFSALRRIVRTAEGKALKDTYDQMHSVVRAHHKTRRAKASAAVPADPSPAPTAVAEPPLAHATTRAT